ncbi:hypothetical protein GIB67_024158, partial [Kingdonia uniflora]
TRKEVQADVAFMDLRSCYHTFMSWDVRLCQLIKDCALTVCHFVSNAGDSFCSGPCIFIPLDDYQDVVLDCAIVHYLVSEEASNCSFLAI